MVDTLVDNTMGHESGRYVHFCGRYDHGSKRPHGGGTIHSCPIQPTPKHFVVKTLPRMCAHMTETSIYEVLGANELICALCDHSRKVGGHSCHLVKFYKSSFIWQMNYKRWFFSSISKRPDTQLFVIIFFRYYFLSRILLSFALSPP